MDNNEIVGMILSKDLEENVQYAEGPNIRINASTTVLPGDNIEVTNYTISGKDWTPELDEKQDKLEFSYNENSAISAINGSALAGQGGITEQNSWKQWSEDNGSEGDDDSVYIGKSNSSYNDSYILGRNNYSDKGVNIGYENVISVTGEDYKNTPGTYNIGKFNSAGPDAGAINIGQYNSAMSFGINIGERNSAREAAINIGKDIQSSACSYNFGQYLTSESGCLNLGTTNKSFGASKVVGEYIQASGGSVILGKSVTASGGSLGVVAYSTLEGGSQGLGLSLTGSAGSTVIGNNNYAYGGSVVVCPSYQSNSALRGSLILIGAGSYADMGSYIIGAKNTGDSGAYIVGNYNTASEAGYIIGDNNSAFKGGAAIGNHNFVNGHSIGLGWKNATNDSSAAHSILFGFMNSAVNDRELLDSKNIKLQNLIHYSDELMQAAYNEYTAKSATLYQNSATTSFSCYDRWNDPVNASFYLIDYWYDNSEFGFDILFPIEAGFTSASWNSYDNSKYFYVSNSYSSTLKTKYNNNEISSDFYFKIRYISNYTTLTGTKSQINNYWTEDRTQQYYNYTAASANYYEKVRTNNTYESATSSVKPATNSFIVGTNNSAAHYNSYLFGSYNQSLTYNNTSANDDGFVFAMGFNNMVSRNYDMAIGYGSVASGGENIAIGTPHYSYNNNEAPYAAAIGYKNIAFNAYVEGIMNIAYDSIITIPFSDWHYGNNKFHSVKANTWTYTPSLNFHNNYLDFVNGCTIDVGKNFNCNVINQMSGTTLFTDQHFVFNELFMIDRSNISANETSRNTLKYFREAKMYTNHMIGNILYNLGSGTNLSAAYVTENIFFNEGGSTGNSNDPRNRIALTANNIGQNFIFNTSLLGSATEGAGINQNFLINSHISANHNYLQYGIGFGHDTIGHSFIFGTDISGQATETFSFAASYDSTGTAKKAVLSRVSKITNFGDNIIKNSYDSFVYGDTNTVTSVGNSFVAGRLNLVQGSNNGSAIANSYVTNNNTVFGEANAISNSNTTNDDKFTNSIILGKANGILKNCIDNKCYITDNTIIGSINGLYSIPATAIDNVISVGMYNWVNASAELPYHNILRYSNDKYVTSGQWLVNCYGNNASYNNARNLIIGSHSVISNNINDSTLIGSFNVAYCNQLQTFNTMTANFEPWTSKSYAKSACVVYNGSAFSSTINNNTYTPPNASYWSKITYTEGSSYNTLSNNYVMGSFNLSENGSNQVILGNSNIASGHNSISIGEGLIADASQTVFGRYNIAIEGTNGISADYVDSKSGVLLIVGNGRHINNKTDIDSIERSNAMTVSANGVVSAADYITSAGKKLSDCITSLPTITEYVAGTGIVFTAGAGTDEGKTVIEVDSTNYKLLTTAEYAELTAAVAIISANSARWVLTPAS